MTDAGMSPEAIVDAAKSDHLDVIAVTDHNEIANVERALAAGAAAGLFVVPGVELSTPEGHLLAYFETLESLRGFVGRLTLADRGTPDSRCSTSALQCLAHVAEFKGFAILAHVDGAGGLEQRLPGFPPHKRDILSHGALLAVEVRDPSASASLYALHDSEPERVRIARHRIQTLGLGSKQTLARVLFSDAHSLASLGRNARNDRHVTRFKMERPTFGGLRLALMESDARVRLEDEVPDAVPTIEGVVLEGGFLDGTVVRLSPNLTCIIGGRGAGKSTAFEAIRSLTGAASDSKIVDSEVWPARIDFLGREPDGSIHELRRDHGGQARDADGEARAFHVECYGQGEAAETSRLARTDPGSLLEFVDRLLDVGAAEVEVTQLREALLANQTAIEKADIEVARIPDFEAALRRTKFQLDALKQHQGKEIVELEQRVASEAGLRDLIEEHVANAVAAFGSTDGADHLDAARNVVDSSAVTVGRDAHKAFIAATDKFLAGLPNARSGLDGAAAELRREADAAFEAWRNAARRTTEGIEKRRAALAAQGVKLDMAYIRKLADDEAQHTKTLATLAKWKAHRDTKRAERLALLRQLGQARSKVSARHTAFARTATSALANTLGDLEVSIKFNVASLSPDAEQVLVAAMGWRTSRVPRAEIIVARLGVPGLLDAVRRRDGTSLAALRDGSGAPILTSAEAAKVVETLREQVHTFALERCDVRDRPRLTVSKVVKDSDGTVRRVARDFANLSLGQQQSVLLSLLLASESRRPLLIDQPEDNLDGEFIYNSLVPALRRAKERRQVIVVTHNANIAVLGDADLILALKSHSTKGTVVARGSIDDPATCAMACQVLEGSEEAFARRARTYAAGRS